MAGSAISFLVIALLSTFTVATSAFYNIVDFGARADGRTDSSRPFLSAWAKACGGSKPATIYVPAGTFFLSQALFSGPCNNAAIRIYVDGKIVAPSGYGSSTKWIYFKNVEGVSIHGGTLDGRGRGLWNCKLAGRSCPAGATSLTIGSSKNIVISRMTFVNSKMFHISIQNSNGVTVRGVRIIAPGDSPNTDGVHIMSSNAVTVRGSTIKTGDDCISMKSGVTNVWIERIYCGPGHGISIGSLGSEAVEDEVRNITVKSVVFTGTQNGLRIKTWGKASRGSVTGVRFQNAVMNNVQNPIIIDQDYCPDNINCPNQVHNFKNRYSVHTDIKNNYSNQSSGIKISKVSFRDIRGSSATKVAVTLACSSSNPCSGIRLHNIKLAYGKQQAQSFCRNVGGSTSGFIMPPSCL